jgi:hypothetical protein
MAKAEILGPIKPVEPVVLTLSKEEAQVLVDVISMSAGMPKASRRGLIDGIMKAMRDVGYSYNSAAYHIDGDLYGCNVHFAETK